MFKKFALYLLFFSLCCSNVFAQENMTVNGYFIEDSIKIGVSTPFVLTAKYPQNKDVVFPDSLYDFTPFELGEKFYFPTKSNGKFSYDSAVYYLISFEIDTVQYFQLPAFVVTGRDSAKLLTNIDSIFLTQLVSEIPDSVAAEAMPLIENTTFKTVSLAFNYPYLIAGISILLIAIILVIIFFGKSIRQWFVIRRLGKKHKHFLSKFESMIADKGSDSLYYEHILQLWKKYLEDLEKRPYTKMTTKELSQFDYVKSIAQLLKNIDRAIYGKHNGIEKSDLEQLRAYTEQRYSTKVMEVKNGH